MLRHLLSSLLDGLADLARHPDEISRRDLLDTFAALGVRHDNLLKARDELPDYRAARAIEERIESTLAFGHFRGEPTAYARRERDNLAPQMIEARARVAEPCLGRANLDTWHSWLAKGGSHALWLPGRLGGGS